MSPEKEEITKRAGQRGKSEMAPTHLYDSSNVSDVSPTKALSDHRDRWLRLCRTGCGPIQNQVSQLCVSPAKFKCSAP